MAEPNFEGHDSRYCGEHRTVGPHRAWCFDCSEWCYPHEGCARCREPKHENEIARLQRRCEELRPLAAHGVRNPPEVIAELVDSRNEAQRIATAYQNAAADYRDMQDRAEGLEFQRDELRSTVQRVRELHKPQRLYDECGHNHDPLLAGASPEGAFDIEEVGLTCEAGYMYTICYQCCMTSIGDQSEECATQHEHTPDGWQCPTIQIIEEDGNDNRG